MPRAKPNSLFARMDKQKALDAEAYACVKKIMDAGCLKKSVAVEEAAAELKRCSRSIWASLPRHERELVSEAWAQARADRELRIALGEEAPTDEEVEAEGDRHIQWMIDVLRGK
jgi:hypothetical protein